MNASSPEIVPFRVAMQSEVEALIIHGLTERWGSNDPTKNPDIKDISGSYTDDSFFVAMLDGVVVGTGAITFESMNTGRVVRMSVAQELRGRGIGKLILNHLEQVAVNHGYRVVVLETTESWLDAIGFYESQGYRILGCSNGDAHFQKSISS